METDKHNGATPNILARAAAKQAAFKEIMASMGYTVFTTFYNDLTIAENGGAEAIRDTYGRVNKEWRKDVKHYTEFVMSLNHKIWEHHDAKNDELAVLYNDLWAEADNWALENYKGEDLAYFLSITD